jgi:hypothetical protein
MGERSGAQAPGTCGPNVGWSRQRIAPASGNGGWNSRGFLRYTLCDHDPHTSLGDAWQAGFAFDPPGTSTVWPATTYIRFRLYVEGPLVSSSIGNTQLKWFIWHQGVWGGDQRVMMHFYRGDHCGTSASSTVCLSLLRNIFVGTDEAKVSIPVGQWVHIQGAWRHGPVGTSFVKLWRNNNSLAAPTNQQTSMDVCRLECPSQPGGTSEWVRDEAGYHGPFDWGNRANTSTYISQDWTARMMDLEIDDAFDPTWAPDATSTGLPNAPSNLRIVPLAMLSLLPAGALGAASRRGRKPRA